MKKACCQGDGRRPIIRENKSVQGCHWRREEQPGDIRGGFTLSQSNYIYYVKMFHLADLFL